MSTSPPPVFSDRYELVRHIARGGMAQVYLARDLLLDRQVALKVLFPELSVDQSFVQRFRREAQAAANLSHPNIVSIYDWGQGEHTYCIVMEYVDGQTLSAIARQAALDPVRAAEIGAYVADALEFAHHRGVIHRDVKPGNVLIDSNGQVKVADFGIARAVGAKEGLTQTGAVMGTATYFSPEQAQGYPVDARSDVYSLGVVLYEVVAGKAPFTGDNPVAIAYKHVREAPVPLREVDPTIPAAYEAVVAKAMAKDADDRYQTAAELGGDLERFRQGQPVTAVALAAAAVGATRVQPVATTTAMPHTMVEGPYQPAEVVEEEHPAHHRRWVVALIALLVLAAILVFFLGRSLGWWASSPSRMIPTDVVGKPAQAATAELKQIGFTKITTTNVQSATVHSGDVVSTDPTAGSTTPTNHTITLAVSTGPQAVPIPDVANQPEAAATATLKKLGFRVKPIMQASDTVAQDDAIGTDPAAGQQLGQGSTITLFVSSGKATVPIPSVVGESATTASNKLGNLNLQTTVAYESSSSEQQGDVTRTSPPAGSSVAVGSTVTIYVSTGPITVTVPDLSNDTQSQAASALATAELKASFTMQAVSSSSQNGIVIAQSPTSGTRATMGSTVTVTIGAYTAPTTSTPTSPSTSTPPTTPTPTPGTT